MISYKNESIELELLSGCEQWYSDKLLKSILITIIVLAVIISGKTFLSPNCIIIICIEHEN